MNDIVTALVTGDFLRAVPLCPVCGSDERRFEHARSASDPYTDAMARELGFDPARIEEVFSAFRCRRCETLWSDPWLSARTMGRVYAVVRSRHESGWKRFDAWRVRSSDKASVPSAWELLVRVAGRIDSYAELNCPFWGLLPYLRDCELGGEKQAHTAATLEWLREIANDQRDRPPPAAKADARAAATLGRENGRRTRRALVFESSSCFWSHGCEAGGVSCRGVGAAVLGAEVLDFKDVEREAIRFDALSLVNCLDHFIDPIAVVERALACSRLVFVDSHSEGDGGPYRRQHPFVLGPRALQAVAAGRWAAVDVSGLVGGRFRQAHLLSAETELRTALNALARQKAEA